MKSFSILHPLARTALHCASAALLLTASAGHAAAKGGTAASPPKASPRAKATVPIAASVPESIQTVHAPDTDPAHYRVLEGTHFSYRCHDPYTFPNRTAAVEVCEIDPVTLEIRYWPETEVIHLVRGEVTITEPDGRTSNHVAGDIFVLPRGFKGVWRQSGQLLKVVVRQPLYWKD
ncbi:MAG: hypothetical protein RJA98_2941 [Pseudomonadota bacterium]